MSAFKVVGRYSDHMPSWLRGKIGTQCKKRVYISREDFNKYSPDIIKRWETFMGLDVSVHQEIDGKWFEVVVDKPKKVKK